MGKHQRMCIISVSVFEKFKIYVLSIFFGTLVTLRITAKWIWDSKSFYALQQRDNPPSCLVESFLGQHKYVKLKGVKLHYVESGQSNDPLVLLLHGFPDCWLSWRYQIPSLSEHFRVIALDLKGFGDSDKPFRRNDYRIEVILSELKQLIATLHVSNCIIIGHDIGALLGWYLAQQCPEVVAKLVVISCPHPNIFRKNLHTSSMYQWLHFVQLPCLPEIDALKEDVKIISDYHKHLPQHDIYLEAYKYSFSRKEDWTGPINYYRNLPFSEISEKSDPIQVAVLLVTGSKDRIIKLESVVKSTDYCEKSNVKIIDSAEHFPHQENPDMFNRVLLKYLLKRKVLEKIADKSPTKGVMNRMLGAVNQTVKYGNSLLDNVQKRTSGVVAGLPVIPSMNLLNYNSSFNNTFKAD